MKAVVLFTLLLPLIFTKCSDQLSCFRNKLFNFGSPSEDIYLLNSITNNSMDK